VSTVFFSNKPTDGRTHETAFRIARRCRHTIQACLREEEWVDADREFYRIAREELEAHRTRGAIRPG
jgi:hypothetical protein